MLGFEGGYLPVPAESGGGPASVPGRRTVGFGGSYLAEPAAGGGGGGPTTDAEYVFLTLASDYTAVAAATVPFVKDSGTMAVAAGVVTLDSEGVYECEAYLAFEHSGAGFINTAWHSDTGISPVSSILVPTSGGSPASENSQPRVCALLIGKTSAELKISSTTASAVLGGIKCSARIVRIS